jgi:glycosyltransferase involved in cell wall biosynthesis
MKILFISDNFPPEVNAPASRTYDHCRRWVEKGAEVTVITCAPNFPQGKVYEGYKNRLHQSEMVDGIRVIRVWSYMSSNEGFLKRILDYISFSFMAFWVCLFRSCDVIVATSPQFFTTFPAYTLSKLKQRPWVFELRDLWPDTVKAVGAMKDGLFIRVFERIEIFLYHDADLIIPVTDRFKENLISRGIDADKIRVVTNGVLRDKFVPVGKDQQLVKQLGLEDKFVFGYIGTHGMTHGLDFIVESMAEVESESIHFLFVGAGACKQMIVDLAKNLELKNVTFLDPVSKDEVVRYVSVIDAALIPLKDSPVFRTVLPSKIFESAAMKKPILLGVDGQARQLIEKYQSGLFFQPENKKAFLDGVERMVTDDKLYAQLQEGGRKLAVDFDRNTLADVMMTELESLQK